MKLGRWGTLSLLLCASFSISGCQDQSSPDGIIGSAYSQLNDGNLKEFQQDLSGNALAIYGSSQGMAALRAKLGTQQFTLSSDQIIGHSHDQYGEPTAIYQVATQPTLLSFTVICAEIVSGCSNPPLPGQPDNCTPVVSTHCSISEILTESQLARAAFKGTPLKVIQ